jgi:hypothetical protein
MKKVTLVYFIVVAATLMMVNSSDAQTEIGMYAQLHASSSKRFVFQMVPGKTYEKVVAYVNFYGADNKRIAQRAYSITDDKDKYVRKGVCTTRVFKFSLPGEVARVKIDHVNEGEILHGEEGDNAGKKIDLPVAKAPLEAIDK